MSIQQNTTSIFINSELLSSSDFFNYSIILFLRKNKLLAFQRPRNVYSELKIDIQNLMTLAIILDTRFTKLGSIIKIVIVKEKKMIDEDWHVLTSLSLSKPLLEILKLKALGPRISAGL